MEGINEEFIEMFLSGVFDMIFLLFVLEFSE